MKCNKISRDRQCLFTVKSLYFIVRHFHETLQKRNDISIIESLFILVESYEIHSIFKDRNNFRKIEKEGYSPVKI
ncbi:MAG: hypothetical protein JETT_3800 [Candidatus Jettenia ecosi]|uniref:Uncharacterized protein n=1 Tax=Candidatus Jettenia ecosi TaxID=2494326 RepID=A0A533Q5W0_9BACT|nr:MAG: hypothetical protein JETT_3800 [Candidatus Jettenia ecosi]